MKFIPLTLLILVLWTVPASYSGAADLSDFLPENTVWKPVGPATRTDNEAGLFATINGGAERYLRYGFKRALYKRFQDSAERRISMKILIEAAGSVARRMETTDR